MKVVILCGGQGTRLREQTEYTPKPMVKIGGEPILWHIMKTYSHFGLSEFVLCLGYKGQVIRDYFSTNGNIADWNVSLVETGEAAMTGARVFRVRELVGDQPFCLTYGDGLGTIDVEALLEFHKEHGKLATVTGVRPPSRFGELRLEGDRVVAFSEKPQVTESFINGGFFVLEPAFIDRYLADDDSLTLEREPLQRAALDGELMMFAHTGFWQPMDTYREWKMLDEMWEAGTAEWKIWD
jgi:glucose-1-phosphate cytidylyltransferase